ncbi:MAG TPA: PAS domain-containing protein, partial [Verrucomicrobium sp.]|nr:PAS domain-containing protein [Verrucomicrobium sp.]
MPDGQPILDRSGSASPTWDERFKAVAFSEFQFLAILSSEGRVLEISQAALHAGGVARAEVIEQPFWETVWCRKAPEASDYWQGRLVAARASVGSPVHGKSLLHWPGRGDEFVDNSVTMVPLTDGGVDYFVVQAKLTASRVDEEEGVRNQDERFKFVAQATNDAIWDWDVAQNLLWWSDGFTRLFGFERGELEAGLESWTRRVHPADRDAVVRDFHTAVEGS